MLSKNYNAISQQYNAVSEQHNTIEEHKILLKNIYVFAEDYSAVLKPLNFNQQSYKNFKIKEFHLKLSIKKTNKNI